MNACRQQHHGLARDLRLPAFPFPLLALQARIKGGIPRRTGIRSMKIPAACLQSAEPGGQVDQPPRDQVHDLAFHLQLPEDAEQA